MLASAEWQPLNEQERAVVTALSQRLAGFDTVAPDLLLVFVRGYLTDGSPNPTQHPNPNPNPNPQPKP